MKDKNSKEGTILQDTNGIIEQTTKTIIKKIDAVPANEAEKYLVPNFRPKLTFTIYSDIEPLEKIEGVNKPKAMEMYASQLYRLNKEIVKPFTFSIDLIDKLVDREYFDKAPASTKIGRESSLDGEIVGIEIRPLCKEFLKNTRCKDQKLKQILEREVLSETDNPISRKQFEIGIPSNRKGLLAIINPESSISDYPIFKFSKIQKDKNYVFFVDINGTQFYVRPIKGIKGEIFYLTKEDFSHPEDKVAIGFGNLIGSKGDNPKRVLQAYLTQENISPRL